MAALANFTAVSGGSASGVGPVKFDRLTFTGATYATGGTTGLAAGLQGLVKDSRQPIGLVQQRSSGDYELEYLPDTDKLKVYTRSTGAEVADSTSLTAVTFSVLTISK